ncbi:MAG: hypothetical protein WKF83_03630 [Nocardioidaceae bacterium]
MGDADGNGCDEHDEGEDDATDDDPQLAVGALGALRSRRSPLGLLAPSGRTLRLTVRRLTVRRGTLRLTVRRGTLRLTVRRGTLRLTVRRGTLRLTVRRGTLR